MEQDTGGKFNRKTEDADWPDQMGEADNHGRRLLQWEEGDAMHGVDGVTSSKGKVFIRRDSRRACGGTRRSSGNPRQEKRSSGTCRPYTDNSDIRFSPAVEPFVGALEFSLKGRKTKKARRLSITKKVTAHNLHYLAGEEERESS